MESIGIRKDREYRDKEGWRVHCIEIRKDGEYRDEVGWRVQG